MRNILYLLNKQYNNIPSQKRENDKELMARMQELDIQKERLKQDFEEKNQALSKLSNYIYFQIESIERVLASCVMTRSQIIMDFEKID